MNDETVDLTKQDFPQVKKLHDIIRNFLGEKAYHLSDYSDAEEANFGNIEKSIDLGTFTKLESGLLLDSSMSFTIDPEIIKSIWGKTEQIMDNGTKLAFAIHLGSHPAFRRKGKMQNNMLHGLHRLEQSGVHKVLSSVLQGNEEGSDFFYSMGFRVKESYSKIRPDGVKRMRNVWELNF